MAMQVEGLRMLQQYGWGKGVATASAAKYTWQGVPTQICRQTPDSFASYCVFLQSYVLHCPRSGNGVDTLVTWDLAVTSSRGCKFTTSFQQSG